MATTIVTKNSSTAAAVPTAAQLVQGELAVNVADKRLYTEDSVGGIVELGTNPSAEIVANGGIALPDNGKATFGASDDLQIYHDGTDSFISDQGTGNLKLLANDFRLANAANNELMIKADQSSAVTAYYAGAAKLATTSTGIDVTGTATMDGLVVDGNTQVNSVSSAASGTRSIQFYRDSAERGAVRFDYSASAMELQADGSFFVSTGGEGTSLFINGSTRDISFYEDTGTTAKLFWDASAESLGIGTSSPSTILNTKGATLTTTTDKREILLEAYDDGVTNSLGALTGVTFRNSPTTYTAGSFNRTSGIYGINLDSAGYGRSMGLALYTSSIDGTATEKMRIDSAGNLLVGTSDSFPVGTGDTTAGIALRSDGLVCVQSLGAAMVLSRRGSEGGILELRKDGDPVGSIGTTTGGLYIADAGVGFRFDSGGTDDIIPCNATGGAADASINLGSSGARFKDLYLSGGVVFGATGGSVSSKTLDDYESGTWTPTVNAGVTSPTYGGGTIGLYTKIGNLVNFSCRLQVTGGTRTASHLAVTGLPFSSALGIEGGAYNWINGSIARSTPLPILSIQGTNIYFYETDGSTFIGTELTTNAVFTVHVSGTFRV